MKASIRLSLSIVGSILAGGMLLNTALGRVVGAGEAAAQGRGHLTDKLIEILRHQEIVFLDDGQGGLVKTLRFKGVNVQIVDDSGTTDGTPTGLGNLIVGYNEMRQSANERTGAHNLIVGNEQNYSRYGGFVAGKFNQLSGNWASVSGGFNNRARGEYGSVSGGSSNEALGFASSVSGGSRNFATGTQASVSGGSMSTASGRYSSVGGGFLNSAEGPASSVSGGSSRVAQYLNNWSAGGLSESN